MDIPKTEDNQRKSIPMTKDGIKIEPMEDVDIKPDIDLNDDLVDDLINLNNDIKHQENIPIKAETENFDELLNEHEKDEQNDDLKICDKDLIDEDSKEHKDDKDQACDCTDCESLDEKQKLKINNETPKPESASSANDLQLSRRGRPPKALFEDDSMEVIQLNSLNVKLPVNEDIETFEKELLNLETCITNKATKRGRPRVVRDKAQDFSITDKKKRARQLNNTASQRCRDRKKIKAQMEMIEESRLESRNDMLKIRVNHLVKQVEFLREAARKIDAKAVDQFWKNHSLDVMSTIKVNDNNEQQDKTEINDDDDETDPLTIEPEVELEIKSESIKLPLVQGPSRIYISETSNNLGSHEEEMQKTKKARKPSILSKKPKKKNVLLSLSEDLADKTVTPDPKLNRQIVHLEKR